MQNLCATDPISLSKATPLQGWLYKILVCLVDQAGFGAPMENKMQLISQLDCSDSVLMSTDKMSILCFACFD